MTTRDIRARRERLADFIVVHSDLTACPCPHDADRREWKWVITRAYNIRWLYEPNHMWAKHADEFLTKYWPEEFVWRAEQESKSG